MNKITTDLIDAIDNENIEVVALNVSRGAKITEGAFTLAAFHNNIEILKLLMAHGNIQKHYYVPLCTACKYQKWEAVKLIAEQMRIIEETKNLSLIHI